MSLPHTTVKQFFIACLSFVLRMKMAFLYFSTFRKYTLVLLTYLVFTLSANFIIHEHVFCLLQAKLYFCTIFFWNTGGELLSASYFTSFSRNEPFTSMNGLLLHDVIDCDFWFMQVFINWDTSRSSFFLDNGNSKFPAFVSKRL